MRPCSRCIRSSSPAARVRFYSQRRVRPTGHFSLERKASRKAEMALHPVVTAFALRCMQCHASIGTPEPDFRCPQCGNLLEVLYPWMSQSGAVPQASALRQVWRERKLTNEALDRSGVWRFRELLPILDDMNNAVTIREGNTPVYEMPRCAEHSGVDRLLAKHQGMN